MAILWESGVRREEAKARKLEVAVQKWSTGNNTRAVAVVAHGWRGVAEALEGCASCIEKHYLDDLQIEVQERKSLMPEWESSMLEVEGNETLDTYERSQARSSFEACKEATVRIEAEARKWKAKVCALRVSAQSWRDKANALLGDVKACVRLRETEAREQEEKVLELKADVQKLRVIADTWREKVQESENKVREAEIKASTLRSSN